MPVSRRRKNHKKKVRSRNLRLKREYNRFMNLQREAMEKMVEKMKENVQKEEVEEIKEE